MRISQEPNVDVLRQKAELLERENIRLSKRVSELTRDLLRRQGLTDDEIEQQLPLICEGVTVGAAEKPAASPNLTRSGSESRGHVKHESPRPRKGHGPSEQPKLAVIETDFDLDDADKACTVCGKTLERWEGADDIVEVVDVVERRWVLRKNRLAKYRCRCGGCVETAEGPARLIKGGRYSLDVALVAACDKYLNHLPLDRQVRMARREGVNLTTQALWDQVWALTSLLEPVCQRIRHHILEQRVVGVDLTGFSLIEKGGSTHQQMWQLSCPTGIYFSARKSKSANEGVPLFIVDDKSTEPRRYCGTVMMDGAKELLAIARQVGFNVAHCWSHARRNILKAQQEAPDQVKEFLDLVGELYAIERRAVGEPRPDKPERGYRALIDVEKLKTLRDTESRAVTSKIQSWLLAQSCIPGGLLRAGVQYVASRWSALTRFLDEPLIPLDNNQTERSYIGLAIGRRNYVGARSERGLKAAEVFYTLVESARLADHNPVDYLRAAALAALREDTPALPHEWKAET